MSKDRKDLPTTKKAAGEYYKILSRNPLVKEIYVKGSRSPKTDKKPRKNSDWDIEVTTNGSARVKIVGPRFFGFLHADLHVVEKPSVNSVKMKDLI